LANANGFEGEELPDGDSDDECGCWKNR
jgi:hypothetical protein